MTRERGGSERFTIAANVFRSKESKSDKQNRRRKSKGRPRNEFKDGMVRWIGVVRVSVINVEGDETVSGLP